VEGSSIKREYYSEGRERKEGRTRSWEKGERKEMFRKRKTKPRKKKKNLLGPRVMVIGELITFSGICGDL